jgi:hypothetical protein
MLLPNFKHSVHFGSSQNGQDDCFAHAKQVHPPCPRLVFPVILHYYEGSMKRIALLGLFSSCFALGLFAQQANLQPAAVVNLTRSEPISVGQLREEVARMETALGQSLNAQQRREVLDAMINERLVLQAAERDRVTVTDNELNNNINQLKTQMVQAIGRQPTDAEFAAAVKSQTGLDMPAFREQSRRQLIQQNYLLSQKRSIMESITAPTEAEISSTFELHRTQFIRPETVRISAIMVPFGQDAASRTRAREQIDGFAQEIGTSASKFAEVAARSKTANSGFQGGDFGFMPRSPEAVQRFGQAFVNAAFALRSGGISGVIEGLAGSGFWLLNVTETLAMKNLELDDIVQPGTNVTVRAYIGNMMMQEKQMDAFARAVDELHTELRDGGRTFQVFDANLNW